METHTEEQLLGRELKRERKNLGLSQEQLAQRVGLSTQYMSRIERGMHSPSFKILLELGRALGRPAASLVLEVERLLHEQEKSVPAKKASKVRPGTRQEKVSAPKA